MADRCVLPGVGAVQQALQQRQRAHAVVGADGVGQLVKCALLGAEHHGFHVAQGNSTASRSIEQQLLQFRRNQHHVRAECVHQLARGVRLKAQTRFLRFGRGPSHGVFLAHARQLHHAAMRAERLGQALKPVLVVKLHAARVCGNPQKVGDEQQHRLRIRRFEVTVERGEFVLLGAPRVKLPHVANEDHLERSHQ